MKVNGRQIQGPKTEIVAIPRPDGDIVFQATAVLDFTDFEKLCPAPKPPLSKKPNGPEYPDVEHPDYKKALTQWSMLRNHWTVIKSLQSTEGLEWDTVDFSDSTTWKNWETDLRAAGFNFVEISYIQRGALEVNSLDTDKMDQARNRFLALKGEKASD